MTQGNPQDPQDAKRYPLLFETADRPPFGEQVQIGGRHRAIYLAGPTYSPTPDRSNE